MKITSSITILSVVLLQAFMSPILQGAVVNVQLNVSTADGFSIRESGGSALRGALVKIGVFVNTTNGSALSAGEVAALFTGQSTFSGGVTSLLGSFVEIGEAKFGSGLANGSGESGAALRDLTGVTTSYPFGAPYEYNSNEASGTFRRNWLDKTLPIQNANVTPSPFTSINNTKLTGLAVSLIAFNGSTVANSTELLVARNSVDTEVLPNAEGETSNFGLESSSELILGTFTGTPSSGYFQTIPEPGTISLVLLGMGILTSRCFRKPEHLNHKPIQPLK
jgi:hypothetical protein